jgi:cellulose synthase/poly-beta-1,6-N-acetylglucosamine synthase-like glycosyltransferase
MFDPLWEPYWSLALAGAGTAYLTVLWKVHRGLLSLSRKRPSSLLKDEDLPKVSIIIPCRDEAPHIGKALDDLACQDYPRERLQVIVVDDRSEDGTGDIALGKSHQFADLQVIENRSCPAGVSPKKHALEQGIRLADGGIFITTDGDCRFQRGWVRALVSDFADDVDAVAGLTVFHREIREPLWQKLQQLDYLSHSFFAAGAIAAGTAFNCNGSNLALRRSAFEDVGGYRGFSRVVTGDDTLLIQRLWERRDRRVVFCRRPESIVRSYPEETVARVLHQRLRWGSGGLNYSPRALAFALATFAFFLMLLVSPFLQAAGLVAGIWGAVFLFKVWQEGRVMAAGWRTFSMKSQWGLFFLLELLHIPAVLTFSTAGHLFGFRWKGQRFKRTRSVPAEYHEATQL